MIPGTSNIRFVLVLPLFVILPIFAHRAFVSPAPTACLYFRSRDSYCRDPAPIILQKRSTPIPSIFVKSSVRGSEEGDGYL